MSKRARLTGKGRESDPPGYAQVPGEVLESEAWATLTGTGSRALVVLASQYTGSNNGRLTLPFSVACKRGILRKGALSAGLAELERRGLIEVTYQGGLPPLGCSRYALGWRAVDGDLTRGLKAESAPNRWATWRADDAERAKRRKAPTPEQRWPHRNQKPSPVSGPAWSGQRTTDGPVSGPQTLADADSLVRSTGTSEIRGRGEPRGTREKSAPRAALGRARPAKIETASPSP